MLKRLGSCVLVLGLLGAGCGGGPKFRVKDSVLADVRVGDKQGVLSGESALNRADEERKKALLAERQGKLPTPSFNLADFREQARDAERDHHAVRTASAGQLAQAQTLQGRYNGLLTQYRHLRDQVPGPPPAYTPPGTDGPAPTPQTNVPAPGF